MYSLVQQRAATFIALAEASIDPERYRFVKDECDVFLECGILTTASFSCAAANAAKTRC